MLFHFFVDFTCCISNNPVETHISDFFWHIINDLGQEEKAARKMKHWKKVKVTTVSKKNSYPIIRQKASVPSTFSFLSKQHLYQSSCKDLNKNQTCFFRFLRLGKLTSVKTMNQVHWFMIYWPATNGKIKVIKVIKQKFMRHQNLVIRVCTCC